MSLAIRHPVLLPFLLVFIFKEGIMLAAGGILLRRRKRPCAARWYGKVATVLFYITFVSILLMDLLSRLLRRAGARAAHGHVRDDGVRARDVCAGIFPHLKEHGPPEDQLDLDEVMDKHRT